MANNKSKKIKKVGVNTLALVLAALMLLGVAGTLISLLLL